MTKKARGRPKLPEGKAKSCQIQLRLSSEEYEAIQVAADKAGLAKSTFIRNLLREATGLGKNGN